MLIHKSLPVPEWISSGLGFLCPKEGTSGLPSRQPGQSRVVFSEQAGRVLGAGGGLSPSDHRPCRADICIVSLL